MLVKIYVIVICFSVTISTNYANNVCSSIEAYFNNMSTNPNCWHDPDLSSTQRELAENHGFILEEHRVKTDDGHILPTYRLKSLSGTYGKDVIFLQHGMSADSSCFMLNKENSIAFFLARQGFDVWLGNARGCEYCKHEHLTVNDPEYWDYSYHEIALYDLPANFKYVRGKTKKKILYIGHSMGTTALGVYASMRPNEAGRYLQRAILIAPSFYMGHTRGVLRMAVIGGFYHLLSFLPMVNYNVVLRVNSFETQVSRRFCLSSAENVNLCLAFLEALGGKAIYPTEPEKLPFMFVAIRGVSLKCLAHYAQGIRTGTFRMYDYGPKENFVRYHSELPPDYNLTDITISLSWIYGITDNLANTEDVSYAFETFRKPNWDIYEIPHNHIDLFVLNVSKFTILPLLLKVINKRIKK